MPDKICNIRPLLLFTFTTALVVIFTALTSFAQLTVTSTGSTAAALAAKLAGPGITIVSDTLICNNAANGTFVVGVIPTPIGIDSGIILSTGLASATSGAESPLTNTQFNGPGDPDLTSLLGGTIVSKDACALIINFVPKADTVSFRYQFGSEEYRQSTCGSYNDAFAFFISGPGVSATLPGINMATVPGTTIPVAVNSVNSGIVGTQAGCNIANCNSMGPGSPFTAYYINNTGGAYTSYRGYTTVLTAKHHVTPCDTYRIKMVITDAGNAQYDSGVFIEAGSLKTNTYHFDRNDSIGATIAGVPNSIVKGCGTDSIVIKSAYPVPFPTTLNLTYSGTAVSGADYAPLPATAVIPAGDTMVKIPVTALLTTPSGIKTLGVLLTSASICGLIDSLTLTIFDHPAAVILTADTTICTGTSLQILTYSTPGLSFAWSPATYLDDSSLASPTTTPLATTTYLMTATLDGSHCPAITSTVTITTFAPVVTIVTPDTTICEGDNFTIRVNGSSSYLYNWSPPVGLSNPSISNPVAAPTTTTSYTLTTSIAGIGCPVTNHLNVTVISTDFTINTIDTGLCQGYTINLNATITPPGGTYTYLWTGPDGYFQPFLNPVLTTATSLNEGQYFLTVTNAGGCSKSATEHVTVFPFPSAPILASELVLCQYSPALPLLIPHYDNLMWYSSASDTTPSVFAPYPPTDSIGTYTYYASQISFKSNCIGAKEEIAVKVESCCNGFINVPSAFTPNGDGHNDVVKVLKSGDYVISDFSIYDRWGILVFQATNDKPTWDGTYNGVPADMGQYYYYLVVNCTHSDKNPIIKKGDITLIR